MDASTLEPIQHFHFAPWAKELPFEVTISKLTKEEAAKAHNQSLKDLPRSSVIVYTDASSSPEARGIGVGLVAYNYSL